MKKEKYIYERQTKKGSKYFQIQITFKDEYNQSKTFYENVQISEFESRSQALKVAIAIRDKALYEIHTNRIVISSPTVEQLHSKESSLLPCSKATQKKYDSLYNHGINKFADTPIDKITTAQLQENINEYALTHSDDYISKYIYAWSRIYLISLMLGYNVADKTKMILKPRSKKIAKQKQVTISEQDFQTFMSALKTYTTKSAVLSHRARMIYFLLIIMYYTGMRPAEVLALYSEDISDEFISVYKSIGSNNTEPLAVITPKTKQSVRKIPVHPNLVPYLHQLKQEQSTTPLLTELDGSLINSHSISDFIHTLSNQIGIKFNMYMLRHNMATELIADNTSPRTVQDILGHASFNMSVSYARSTEQEQADAIQSRFNKKAPK